MFFESLLATELNITRTCATLKLGIFGWELCLGTRHFSKLPDLPCIWQSQSESERTGTSPNCRTLPCIRQSQSESERTGWLPLSHSSHLCDQHCPCGGHYCQRHHQWLCESLCLHFCHRNRDHDISPTGNDLHTNGLFFHLCICVCTGVVACMYRNSCVHGWVCQWNRYISRERERERERELQANFEPTEKWC